MQRKKILIVYFSRSGRTKALARNMGMVIGADICELVPEKPYPSNYLSCIGAALKEMKNNARPKIQSEIPDPSGYDYVMAGFPVWCNVCPNIIYSFFDMYREQLKDKKIYLFCTHGGSKVPKKIVSDMKRISGMNFAGCMDGNEMNEYDTRAWLGLEIPDYVKPPVVPETKSKKLR